MANGPNFSTSRVLLIALILSCSIFRFTEKDFPLKVEDDCPDCLRIVGFISSFDTDLKQKMLRMLVGSHVGFQLGRRTKFVSSRFKLYTNAKSTFQLFNLMVSGSINPTPGPGPEECSVCRKVVARNHRAF